MVFLQTPLVFVLTKPAGFGEEGQRDLDPRQPKAGKCGNCPPAQTCTAQVTLEISSESGHFLKGSRKSLAAFSR